MSAPFGPPAQPVEQHPVPAEQDSTALLVAEVLATAATLAGMVAGIAFLLAPLGISAQAIEAALKLTSRRAVTPRPRFTANGIASGDKFARRLAREAAAREQFYRAAYVMALSGRLQRRFDQGMTLPEAIAQDRTSYTLHNLARTRRLDAAAQVGLAASQFGSVLGWYRNRESNSETECRVADGHNFEAATPPIIGYPGSVHPRCACEPGPPHIGAGSVDDAVSRVVRLVPRRIIPVTTRKVG